MFSHHLGGALAIASALLLSACKSLSPDGGMTTVAAVRRATRRDRRNAMRKPLFALAVLAGASVPLVAAGAHEGQKMGSTNAHSRHAAHDHFSHNQSKRPAHAAFRYRKGGRCHHYHYYKPVVPDC
jgi:hypothetical protein